MRALGGGVYARVGVPRDKGREGRGGSMACEVTSVMSCRMAIQLSFVVHVRDTLWWSVIFWRMEQT